MPIDGKIPFGIRLSNRRLVRRYPFGCSLDTEEGFFLEKGTSLLRNELEGATETPATERKLTLTEGTLAAILHSCYNIKRQL